MAAGALAQPNVGIKAGLNLANVINADANVKPSCYAGLFVEFTASRTFAIQPEVIYSRQGDAGTLDGYNVWERANYLNIPVMAKITLVDGLTLDMGPQFGFLLNTSVRISKNGVGQDTDVKGAANKFDLSLGMGLSYRLHKEADITFRYNIGLTDVQKKTEEIKKYISINKTLRNSVFQFGMGFWF